VGGHGSTVQGRGEEEKEEKEDVGKMSTEGINRYQCWRWSMSNDKGISEERAEGELSP